MATPTNPIERLDVPVAEVEAQAALRAQEAVLEAALAAAGDESDRIAYAGDLFLVAHPEACTSDATYPGWAERLAEQIAKSDSTRKPGGAS